MNTEHQIIKKLYTLALELQHLTPWQWMFEPDLFGIQSPDLDAPRFVSIMGSAGQYSAVSFYEGIDAAHQFLLLQERAIDVRSDDILLIPHVIVSFDDRLLLQPDERKRIREIGYSLPDRNKWPVFQHVIPGHPPVFPTPPKLRDMIPLLEQTLYVAERARKEEYAYISRTIDGISGLFRVCEDDSDPAKWRDENLTFQLDYGPVSVDEDAIYRYLDKLYTTQKAMGKTAFSNFVEKICICLSFYLSLDYVIVRIQPKARRISSSQIRLKFDEVGALF